MTVWIVKHLRDLRSGKPETDVTAFGDVTRSRVHDFISIRWPDALPWNVDGDDAGDEGEPIAWYRGDNPRYPDEFIEVESIEVFE